MKNIKGVKYAFFVENMRISDCGEPFIDVKTFMKIYFSNT